MEECLVIERKPGLVETGRVLRPVALCVGGVVIAATALVVSPWHAVSGILCALLVLVTGVMVARLWRAMHTLHRMSSDAWTSIADCEEHYATVLRRIMKFVEAREKHGGGHSERVGGLASRIASQLGMSESECERMGLAGELHDIGLLAIPEGVLNQHSRIGVAEFRTIQKHSEVSYEILKPLESLRDVLPAIRYHHERMNGTGYPAGIRDEDIPLGARILAVADAYDAMTHDRPHRSAMMPLDAMRELDRCTPHGYDRTCVEALAKVMQLPLLTQTAVL